MVVINKSIFIIFFQILIIYSFFNSHYIFVVSKIVIPFSFYNGNPDKFLINYSENFLYSEILAGSYNTSREGKKITIFLNLRNSEFLISPRKICPQISFYNINDSISYEYKNNLSQDSFYFYTDIQEKKIRKCENIAFNYQKGNKNEIFCGDLGFNPITNIDNEKKNIVYNLKQNKYISAYDVSFEFGKNKPFENYENLNGKIIIGELPHLYDKKNFFEEQLTYDSINLDDSQLNMYQLKFNKIYVGLNEKEKTILDYNKEDIIVKFEISSGLITGSEIYREYIEKNFFNKTEIENICEKTSDSGSLLSYDIFICDNNIKSKFDLFPELIFYSTSYNYNFTFNYEDLFMLTNNKYYFKIIFVGGGYNQWRFGLSFLLKYKLVFNQDSKNIGFYNKNIHVEKKDNKFYNKIWFWIIILVIISIISIACIFVIKKVYGKNRRKKANELEDGYDYDTFIGGNNDNNKNNNKNEEKENNNNLFGNEKNN